MKEQVTDTLTDETRAQAREIVARYPEGRSRSALLPMLHLVQSVQGYVSPAGIAFCAEELGLTKAEVGAVATFYTMYKRKPTGEYLVSVCTNLSCSILGGEEVFARLSHKLGVGHDQTTADGRITLEHAECLAACDYAPVATVNYEFFDNVTEDSASEIVDALLRGELPQPTRGAPLCSFREIEHQLAGFRDPRGANAVAGLADGVQGGVGHPRPPHPVDVRGTEPLDEVSPVEAAGGALPPGDAPDEPAPGAPPGTPPEASSDAPAEGTPDVATAAVDGADTPSPTEGGPLRGVDQEVDIARGTADATPERREEIAGDVPASAGGSTPRRRRRPAKPTSEGGE